MDSSSTLLLSDLPKYKRNISFFKKEFRQVCTGINLEATCTNPSCECVLNFRGMVVVKYPGVTSCVYQEVVPHLRCPSCRSELQPEEVKGVVFVRCEAKISIGVESVEFRVRGDDTTLWELPCQGADVLITILDRDPEPKTESKEFQSPGDGVNLSAVCRNNKCQASITNNGRVIIRVGRVKSKTYQELLNNRSCPSCNHPLEPRCFHGVIFNTCQGEVEIADNVQRFNAHQMPKLCKIDLTGHVAVIRMKQTSTDIHSAPNSSPETVISDQQEKPSSPQKTEASSVHDQFLEEVMGKHLQLISTPGLSLVAKCPNLGCSSNEKDIGVICIGIGSANSMRYKEIILGQSCPSCHQPVPLASFKGILFFQCKAKVVICGEETEYVAGRIPQMRGISLDGAEVEITVLHTRAGPNTTGQVSPKSNISRTTKGNITHTTKSDKVFTRACIGLNLEAMCINPTCEASIVVVPCPSITECVYSSLLTGLVCPGCLCVIAPLCFIGITLINCKAEVRIGNEKHIVTAEGDDTVDFKINLQGPPVYVKILKRDIFTTGELSGGIGKQYLRSTPGLNGAVVCKNPNCIAFKENDGDVVVNFRSVSSGVLSEVAKSMSCPACSQHIPLSYLKAVVFVRCSGQIQIGSENESFNSFAIKTSTFRIFPEGPKVTFTITQMDSLLPAKGLNLLARCSNTSCPSQSQPQLEGIVNLNIGEVTHCRLKQLIQGKTCPCCHHALPPASFISTTFTQCTARVKTSDYDISYLFGERVESVPIGISKDPVVDILPLHTKLISMEPYGSPYKQMKRGMNLKVICSNLDCTSKKSTDGIIIITLHEMKLYTLNDLFSTVKCPSCNNKLSHMILLTLSFMNCRAEILVGKDRFVIEAKSGEAIDFKPDSSSLGIKIHVMDEGGNTSVLFPNDPTESSTSKGAKFSHSSICHGLNFKVECLNPTCEAVKKSEYVMIQSGHIIDCDLRSAMQSLNCSSCDARIPPNHVKDATFLCCSGEITIRGKKEKFNPTGQATADFKIPNDNSPVIVKVYHREYHIVYNPALGFLDTPYTKHHNGVNFHCYCKNPSCTAVNSENGVVIVQRDYFLVHKHGYSPSTCYYSQEISQLSCTSCGSHLRKYYVWGVGLLHCRGTITRDGSPVEHFSPSMGQVAQYELDTGDTSLKIEFQLIQS